MTAEQLHFQEHEPVLDDCGVYAVYSPQGTAAQEAFMGIDALVNRGEHSNGLAWLREDGVCATEKFLGKPERDKFHLEGTNCSIGHVRYTTSQSTEVKNAQPVLSESVDRAGHTWTLAVAHNGNVDEEGIKPFLNDLPEGTSDSAYIAQLIAEAKGSTWLEKLQNSLPLINGSYSCTILTPDGIIAVRDPRENRPLWVGIYADGTRIISSETFELEQRDGLQQMFPVPGGEAVCIDTNGNVSQHAIQEKSERAFCAIEAIYLQRHRSRSERRGNPTNDDLRVELGTRLAQEDQTLVGKTAEEIERSRVVAIPNGGIPYAEGFSEGSDIPVTKLLEKIVNARSYIAANGDHGDVAKKKLAIVADAVQEILDAGVQDLYLVDDSLIRGSQIMPVAQLVREALSEVGIHDMNIHVRICAPVIHNRCDLGIVIRERELFYKRLPQILVDAGITPSENPDDHLSQVLEYMGITSLQHISTVGLVESLSVEKVPEEMGTLGQAYCALGYCISCMQSGETPVKAYDWYPRRQAIQLEI